MGVRYLLTRITPGVFAAALLFAFEGGAKDEHLIAPGAQFPFDSFGRPTFRPSAEWYMEGLRWSKSISTTRWRTRGWTREGYPVPRAMPVGSH